MSNKNASLDANTEHVTEPVDDTPTEAHEKTEQDIFEERFAVLMDSFGQTCEAENVNFAIAIAVHPDETEPIVFIRGGEYDAARLLAYVLRNIKSQIQHELRTEN